MDSVPGPGAALQGGRNLTIKEWTDYWMEVYDKPNVRRTTYEARRYIFQNH
ncbi:MAG: hypothetical protein AAGU32_20090, partial [Bacillota bacterium]